MRTVINRPLRPRAEFDLRSKLPGFETFANAKARRSAVVRITRTKEKAVAAALAKCRRGRRCCSGACPVCARRFRLWMVNELGGMFRDVVAQAKATSRSPTLVAVSVVPSGLAVAEGSLVNINLDHVRDKLRKTLVRHGAGDDVLVAGVDFSLNESPDGQKLWQPHLYLVAATTDRRGLIEALASMCAVSDTTKIPIKHREVSDSVRSLSYVFKPFFVRRISYADKVGIFRTRKLPLRPGHLAEVSAFLDRWGFTGRLMLRGCQRRGNNIVCPRLASGRQDESNAKVGKRHG